MTKRTIAIAGGIGSGKSMVSAVLRMMDYPVYDCDSRAKKLMASDGMLRCRLIENFGEAVFEEGVLNRSYLSRLVFGDVDKLARLNALVHPCVKSDLKIGVAANLPMSFSWKRQSFRKAGWTNGGFCMASCRS